MFHLQVDYSAGQFLTSLAQAPLGHLLSPPSSSRIDSYEALVSVFRRQRPLQTSCGTQFFVAGLAGIVQRSPIVVPPQSNLG